jgi:tetratricopeptide (TPR) repeat protein
MLFAMGLGRVVGGVVVAVIVVGVMGCGSPRTAKAPASPVSSEHRDMLVAMEKFLAAPLESSAAQWRDILQFVEKSPDIEIIIEEAALPFFSEDLDMEAKSLLLTGFIAGNAARQLRTGVPGNDLAAGVGGELEVYRALQAAASTTFQGRKVRSAGLDAFLDLEQKGQLRAHLERVRAARERAIASGEGTTSTISGPETDEAVSKLALEGARLVRAGRAAEAITHLDKVIASYEQRYSTEKRHIYCAHYPAEAAAYMVESAGKGEEAIAISAIWAEAWFLKSYALTELRRPAEARAALDRALALSPRYSQYLAELGFLHQKAQQWQRSLEIYKEAEDAVALISNRAARVVALTRAWRGQGHALIELGDLDAAEERFQRSLSLDPDDQKSKDTLEYIMEQRRRRL